MKKTFAITFIAVHTIMPSIVGKRNETSVHLRLWLSFFIVMSVVEHGQCISENTIAQSAVTFVQPAEERMEETDEKL